MQSLYFNTVNQTKVAEIAEVFCNVKLPLKFLNKSVIEILSDNIESVIKAKAAKAFELCRVPVIVEHGALCIAYLHNFPGALSKPMWDLMGSEICNLIPKGASRKAKVLSGVCYCDGITRKVFIGETVGLISEEALGSHGFQWDPIFIPDGETRTYAEMPQTEKLKYSQAAKAYFQLQKELKLI